MTLTECVAAAVLLWPSYLEVPVTRTAKCPACIVLSTLPVSQISVGQKEGEACEGIKDHMIFWCCSPPPPFPNLVRAKGRRD